MPKLPVLGQTYTARSTQVHGDECVNYYPDVITKDRTSTTSPASQQYVADHPVVLYCTPGLKSRLDTSQGSVRGLLAFNGYIYCVAADKFYQLTQSSDGVTLTATLKGTLPAYPVDTMGPVSIVSNGELGNQLLILTGINNFCYNIDTQSFAAITDPFGITTAQATYQDGYLIAANQGTNQWFISDLLDASNWDSLNFASSTSKCDNLIAVASLKQYIYLFGQYGAEVWYNSGTTALDGTVSTFPFSRVSEAYIEQGCAAPFSLVRTDGSLFWLSQSERGQGYIAKVASGSGAAVIVSTPPINDIISKMSTISDCIAYTYQDRGHEFIVFSFPTADQTLVYDLTNDLWHTRASVRTTSPGTTLIQGRHQSNCYAFLNGVHYVGDYASGNVYQMSTSFLDDNGAIITRRRRSGHFNSENKRISVHCLELDMTRGAGLTTGQGSDPQITLQVSTDGGYTFVSKGSKSFGTLGSYSTRIQWNLLGSSRDWVFDFTVTDPVDHVLMDCYANVHLGTA